MQIKIAQYEDLKFYTWGSRDLLVMTSSIVEPENVKQENEIQLGD